MGTGHNSSTHPSPFSFLMGHTKVYPNILSYRLITDIYAIII
jgi:hypothetical protein